MTCINSSEASWLLAIPVDIVETLMGHEGYLTGDRRYSEKELGEYYSKGEHNFLLITPPESMVNPCVLCFTATGNCILKGSLELSSQ